VWAEGRHFPKLRAALCAETTRATAARLAWIGSRMVIAGDHPDDQTYDQRKQQQPEQSMEMKEGKEPWQADSVHGDLPASRHPRSGA